MNYELTAQNPDRRSQNLPMQRFDTPTCLLKVWAERSPLSEWSDRTVVQSLRFRLSIDRHGRQQVIKGNQQQLEKLINAVTAYVDRYLAVGDDTQLRHTLTIPNLPRLELSTLQLFDLCTSLERCANEIVILPSMELEGQRLNPAWLKIVAIVVAMLGLTAVAARLILPHLGDQGEMQIASSPNALNAPSGSNEQSTTAEKEIAPSPVPKSPTSAQITQPKSQRPKDQPTSSQSPQSKNTPTASAPDLTWQTEPSAAVRIPQGIAVAPPSRAQTPIPPAPIQVIPYASPDFARRQIRQERKRTDRQPRRNTPDSLAAIPERMRTTTPFNLPEAKTSPSSSLGQPREQLAENSPEQLMGRTTERGVAEGNSGGADSTIAARNSVRESVPSPSANPAPMPTQLAKPNTLGRNAEPSESKDANLSASSPVKKSTVQVLRIETNLSQDLTKALTQHLRSLDLPNTNSQEIDFVITLEQGRVTDVQQVSSSVGLSNRDVSSRVKRSLLNWAVPQLPIDSVAKPDSGKISLRLKIQPLNN